MDLKTFTTIKYVIVGDSSVGKSSLFLHFTEGQFRDNEKPTIGADTASKDMLLDKKGYKIQLYGVSGQEIFRQMNFGYYKNKAVALLVYEIDKRESFEHITRWMEDIKKNAPKNVLMILVGNKCDLEDNREVSQEEGKEFAEKNGMKFFETSAKTGQNVEEVFKQGVEIIAKRLNENVSNLEDDYNYGIKIEKNENNFGKNLKKEKENSICERCFN